MSDIPYNVTPTQVAGGYDIEIQAIDGHRIHPKAEMSGDGRRCVLHIRDYAAPKVGQEACVCGMFVKVKSVWFASDGRCMIQDEYSKATMPWSA